MDALGVLLIWAQAQGRWRSGDQRRGREREFCCDGVLGAAPLLFEFDALLARANARSGRFGGPPDRSGRASCPRFADSGTGAYSQQLIDIPGHVALLRQATARVYRAGRLVSVMITFTVLSWTGSQALGYLADQSGRGRSDFALLSRSRATYELALEQASFAALTPLRDLAGLGDNLPLLVCAAFLVFRASSGMTPRILHPAGRTGDPQGNLRFSCREEDRDERQCWAGRLCFGAAVGFTFFTGWLLEPRGVPTCLWADAWSPRRFIIPLLMVLCDGFLLAWVLAELRIAAWRGRERSGFPRARP